LGKSDENTLTILERKILRIIFGPVKENILWKIHNIQESMNLCRKPDIISEIIKGRLTSLGHVERKFEEKTVKNMFKNNPERKYSVEKPRKRWLDDAENDLKKMGVRGWRKIAKDRDAWKLILKEARILHGP
jgi:hypothetical protein